MHFALSIRRSVRDVRADEGIGPYERGTGWLRRYLFPKKSCIFPKKLL